MASFSYCTESRCSQELKLFTISRWKCQYSSNVMSTICFNFLLIFFYRFQHMHTQKLHYISQNPGASSANLTVANSVYGLIGMSYLFNLNFYLLKFGDVKNLTLILAF